jgi:hypothetical protein
MSRYMGYGWYVAIDGDQEHWQNIGYGGEQFSRPLPADPAERQARLAVLGFKVS